MQSAERNKRGVFSRGSFARSSAGRRFLAYAVSMKRRQWAAEAIRRIEADFNRSADTHLLPLSLSGLPHIDLYFKDESTHPTGSLKHRLARSLFLFALANGWLRQDTLVIEASSGSTAVSEAYLPDCSACPSRR